MKKLLTLIMLVLLTTVLYSQETEFRVETRKIHDNIYEIYTYLHSNLSVNIYAFIGEEGTLLIDTGLDQTVDLVQKELQKIGATNIRYIINTHDDGDHTWGNKVLGTEATIISHINCKKRLANNPRFKDGGLPNLTFQDSLTIYFNNEEIILRYIPGHTDNDIYAEFKNAKLLFMGDMAFENSFPIVHGHGNIDNVISSLKRVQKLHPPETKMIVSHGKPTKVSELNKYLKMIEDTKAKVLSAIKDDVGLDEAIETEILKEWDSWNSNVFHTVNEARWIETIYKTTDEGKARSGAFQLNEMIDNQGYEKAGELFKAIRTNKKYYFAEADFNVLGYEYLFAKKIKEAIVVFQINTDLYPESANAYDSLGEAYMTDGNNELAIENYKISLKLNPENENAKQMIKKMTSNN